MKYVYAALAALLFGYIAGFHVGHYCGFVGKKPVPCVCCDCKPPCCCK